MPSALTSILRGINRTNKKFNILTINNSEAFQCSLAKTEHNFYFMQHSNIRSWNILIRPVPNNCYMLFGEDVSKQFTIDTNFDLVLCQNRQHYNLLRQVADQIYCPIINIEYSLSDPNLNPHVIESMAMQSYDHYIFISEFVCASWGFESEKENINIIPHGIDTDIFNQWKGKSSKILSISRKPNHISGLEFCKTIAQKFPIRIINNDYINFEQLISEYQQCQIYLNTAQWHACPLSLLEAMSCGCPIVSTNTASLDDIVTNNDNALIANDENEIVECIKKLNDDKNLSYQIGLKAREFIIKHYNIKQFISNWNDLLDKCVDKARSRT